MANPWHRRDWFWWHVCYFLLRKANPYCFSRANRSRCASYSWPAGCGNGKSTAPEAGYSFAEQFTDLEAVIKGLDIEQFYLMSYSMGVPYAVQAAIKYPQKLKGLIICDYSARIPQVPNGWAQNLIDNDKIEPERAHVVKAIERELKSVDLTEELNQIQCPVLVMRGLKEGSLLKDAKLEEYKNRLNHLEIIEFENSGHELWHPDVEYFRDTIQAFMKKYD